MQCYVQVQLKVESRLLSRMHGMQLLRYVMDESDPQGLPLPRRLLGGM